MLAEVNAPTSATAGFCLHAHYLFFRAKRDGRGFLLVRIGFIERILVQRLRPAQYCGSTERAVDKLLYGCCHVIEQPPVCVCVRSLGFAVRWPEANQHLLRPACAGLANARDLLKESLCH